MLLRGPLHWASDPGTSTSQEELRLEAREGLAHLVPEAAGGRLGCPGPRGAGSELQVLGRAESRWSFKGLAWQGGRAKAGRWAGGGVVPGLPPVTKVQEAWRRCDSSDSELAGWPQPARA